MTTSDPSKLSRERLEALCERLQRETTRHVVVQQQLNAARDRIDRELTLFRAIQHYVERALSFRDFQRFAEFTLEAVIEAFEFDVGLFLQLRDNGELLVVEQFGFDEVPGTLAFDPEWFVADQSTIVGTEADVLRAWSGLELAQAIVCPFADERGKLRGVILGGIRQECSDYFEPITPAIAPPFAVMVHQAGLLWLNQEMTDRVRRHNEELITLTDAYARFVPFEFLDLLRCTSILEVHAGDHVSLEMTVAFIDLREFSTMAEALGATGTFAMLNEYLATMEPRISGAGGFINQYFGDGIMALFPGGADCALEALIGMTEALQQLNATRRARNEAPLKVGAGINTGRVMLGSIGGDKRLDTGVVGDAVNLAARTEGLTKVYGATVVMTENCYRKLERPSSYRVRLLDRVVVKGRSDVTGVYELLDADPEPLREQKLASAELFEQGRDLYVRGEFSAACKRFERCIDRVRGDSIARLYLERCRQLASSPPREWNGVTVMGHK